MQQADLIVPATQAAAAVPQAQPQLLRCPCCGGAPTLRNSKAQFAEDTYWYWVECSACGLATRYMAGAAERCTQAVATAWNTRTPASKSAAKESAQ